MLSLDPALRRAQRLLVTEKLNGAELRLFDGPRPGDGEMPPGDAPLVVRFGPDAFTLHPDGSADLRDPVLSEPAPRRMDPTWFEVPGVLRGDVPADIALDAERLAPGDRIRVNELIVG